MFVKLRNTLGDCRTELYIKTERFNRDMEKAFVELYYRGLAEGLVEEVGQEVNREFKIVSMNEWLKKNKQKRELNEREEELFGMLEG